MHTFLNIPVVNDSGDLTSLMEQIELAGVSRWLYEDLGDLDEALATEVQSGRISQDVAEVLVKYRYSARLLRVTDPQGNILHRTISSGSPYATNLVWTKRIEDFSCHILVGYESKGGARGITANFPTGSIEISYGGHQTAINETAEETGLAVEPRQIGSGYCWASRHFNLPFPIHSTFISEVTEKTTQFALKRDPNEQVVFAWVNIDYLFSMIRIGEPFNFENDAKAALCDAIIANDNYVATKVREYLDFG